MSRRTVLLVGLPGAAVCCCAMTAAGLYYAVGTPSYSLFRMRQAMRRGDAAAFYAYFDTEAVARNAIAHVAARKRPLPQPTPRPTIPPRAADLLTERVESKIRDQLDRRLNDPQKSFLNAIEFLGLKREASVATATIRDRNRGSETKLRLVQSAGRRWKVVDLDLQTIGMTGEDNTLLAEPVPAAEREEGIGTTTASRRHAAPTRDQRPERQRVIGNR